MYKFEVHLHTSACSGCAVSTCYEMIDAAVEHGYSGIVITNHFFHGNTCVDRNKPWREFVKAYADDYYNAKKYGEEKGITVLFGIEEGYRAGKEVLIYGLSPENLSAHPEFNDMDLSQKSEFVHSYGGIIVHAHPFRVRDYIPDPAVAPDADCLDGVECFNFFNGIEDNVKAFIFAENTGKLKFSGMDIHDAKHFGSAGLDFDNPVKSNKDFIEQVKKGNYKLITPYNL